MSHDIANRGEILLYSDENGREFGIETAQY